MSIPKWAKADPDIMNTIATADTVNLFFNWIAPFDFFLAKPKKTSHELPASP
jgi:hypothetical protein